jgi:hypothetical protein
LGELFANPQRRDELGRNALRVVNENLGAVARTVDMIVEQMEKRGCYIAPVNRGAKTGGG